MYKRFQYLILLQIALFFAGSAAAQPGEPVKFLAGNYLPSGNVRLGKLSTATLQKAKAGGQYFVLLQFSQLPSVATLEGLKKAGVILGDYLPGNARLACLPATFNFGEAAKWGIGTIDELPTWCKLDGAFSEYKGSTRADVYVMAVQYFTGTPVALVTRALDSLGATYYTGTLLKPEQTFLLQVNLTIVPKIAALPFVSSISLLNIKDKPLNYNSIAAHGASTLIMQILHRTSIFRAASLTEQLPWRPIMVRMWLALWPAAVL
jgi:hypothetical protein